MAVIPLKETPPESEAPQSKKYQASSIERLSELISGQNISQAAQMLNISRPKLSRILKGDYPGAEAEAARLCAVIERTSPRAASRQTGASPSETGDTKVGPAACDTPARAASSAPEMETAFQRQARVVLGLCARFRRMGVITAPSGSGKTHLCLSFLEDSASNNGNLPGDGTFPGSATNTTNPATPGAMKAMKAVYFRPSEMATTGSMLESLGKVLGLKTGYGTLEARLSRIIDELKKSDTSLLIVDEADVLAETKRPSTAVRMYSVFRQIAEAGIGIALVGLPTLRDFLRRLPGYMANRLVFDVDGNAPNAREMMDFFRIYIFEGLKEGNDGVEAPGEPPDVSSHPLTARILEAARAAGYFRYLSMLREITAQGVPLETAYSLLWRG